MRDIWNRPVKIGDLVLYNSCYYVVISEDSLFSINGNIVNQVDYIYLVENPIEQESLLLSDFTNKYNAYLKAKMENKELNKSRIKENKSKALSINIGDIVKESNSYNSTCYLYLGEGSYTDYDGKFYSGHLYVKVHENECKKLTSLDLSDTETLKKILICNYFHRVDYRLLSTLRSVLSPLNNRVIKTFKNKSNKFIEVCHHLDLSSSSCFTVYDRYDYSLTNFSYHFIECWEESVVTLTSKNI